jgi:hypothetical protein
VDSLERDLESLSWTDGEEELRALVHARSAVGLAAPSLSVLRPAIDAHFSRPTVPAILASLAGETRPEFRDWAAQTEKLMRSRSPTMMAVALRQLERGSTMQLSECLRMELGMVEQSFQQGDFMEGIRSLIIDNDNAPRWNPAHPEEVAPASVDAFFRDRWRGGLHPLGDLERTVLRR